MDISVFRQNKRIGENIPAGRAFEKHLLAEGEDQVGITAKVNPPAFEVCRHRQGCGFDVADYNPPQAHPAIRRERMKVGKVGFQLPEFINQI